jgi:predicted HAD superfamily Cof-like phosphohydrolase
MKKCECGPKQCPNKAEHYVEIDGSGWYACDNCVEYFQRRQSLRQQVAEFHAAMGMQDPTTPTIPSDDRVRLRAKLIAEEFFEVMEAMFNIDDRSPSLFGQAKDIVSEIISGSPGRLKYPVRINMPELADGIADLNYVSEGTNLEFGIDSAPIAAEVHKANMAKFIGEPVWSEPASPGGARKRLKPAGWTPPDIAGELRKQGWKP